MQGTQEESFISQTKTGCSTKETKSEKQSSLIVQTNNRKTQEQNIVYLLSPIQETERMVQFGARSERRVEELESGVERLRNQQDVLKRKLKKQTEKKTKLEV